MIDGHSDDIVIYKVSTSAASRPFRQILSALVHAIRYSMLHLSMERATQKRSDPSYVEDEICKPSCFVAGYHRTKGKQKPDSKNSIIEEVATEELGSQ